MRLGGTVQLLGNRRDRRRQGHFIVIAMAPKIDHLGVMRIAQNAEEVALGERFRVATQQFVSTGAERAGKHGTCRTHYLLRRPHHEVERLLLR